MKTVHRLEIVVAAPHSERLVRLLRHHGVDDYSLIRGVSGSGERGDQYGDDITGISNNHLVVTTCPPDKLDEVTGALKPLLARIGGMCLVSDARWLVH